MTDDELAAMAWPPEQVYAILGAGARAGAWRPGEPLTDQQWLACVDAYIDEGLKGFAAATVARRTDVLQAEADKRFGGKA